jgi:O-antigen ligase
MNKLAGTLREYGVFVLFGFVIVTSLFLGDGKQPLIDVVWACQILLLYAIYHLQNGKYFILPHMLQTAWIIILGYFFISIVFSDSAGYSLSAAVRLFDAYLVYCLFYSIADKKYTRFVGLGVIIICVIATIVSFGCLFFPQLAQSFPLMNLLYATYGHNQLAGLLLFGVPVVIIGEVSVPPWCKKTALLLLLSGMLLSFARGAWILLAAYFVFLLVTKRPIGKLNTSTIVLFVGAAAGLLVVMSLFTPRLTHVPSALNNYWFYKQTIKPSIYESRIQYWLQAEMAIQERPIFGSGPGTFYLQSKRLQAAPNNYSWFAHSFVLEQFVEIGLVGAVFWGILFVAQCQLLIHPRDHALLAGVILTFLYSLFEYNLNFLVIWLLFWSVLGWLTGSVQTKRTEARRFPFFMLICLAFLFLFSVFSVAGAVEAMNNNIDAEFSFTPFVADVVKMSLEKHAETKTPISQQHKALTVFFHKKNPEVMYTLARVSPTALANPFYEQALVYDPQNIQYRTGFVTHLLEGKNTVAIGGLIKQLGESVLPEKSKSAVRQIQFTSPAITALYTSSLFEDVGQPKTVAEYFSKTAYFLGLSLVNSDPILTRALWALARDASLGWGYFPAELASLYYYHFHDEQGAKQVLLDCQKDFYARGLCNVTVKDIGNIPKVGTYMREIAGI